MKVRIGAVIVMAGLASAGCNRKPVAESKPAASGVVTIVAHEYGYDLPSVVPAGVTTIEVINRGQELHHMQIARLEDGHTLGDLVKSLEQKTIPTWILPLGGPNGVEPGQSGTTIQTLTPGHYAVLCFIPGHDGVPHFMKGMTGSFDVVASAVTATEEPKADATFNLADYSFGTPTIAAGPRTIRVENTASQPHELVLVRLENGKSVGDMLNWFMAGEKGPAPGHFATGVVGLAPGQHTFFTHTFNAGTYGLLCFVGDVKDGKPHVMHGMMAQFSVPSSVAVKN